MIFIKKTGEDPEKFEKVIMMAKKLLGANLNYFGLVIVSEGESVLTRQGFYDHNEVQLILNAANIDKEKTAIVTLTDKNIYYSEQREIYSPVSINNEDGCYRLTESTRCDHFIAASSSMNRKQLAFPLYQIMIGHKTLLRNDDYETLFNIYKKGLDKEIVVIGSKNKVYIHNRDSLADIDGVLFSDYKLGTFITRTLNSNKVQISEKHALGDYYKTKAAYRLLTDKIFFIENKNINIEVKSKWLLECLNHDGVHFKLKNSISGEKIDVKYSDLYHYYSAFWL